MISAPRRRMPDTTLPRRFVDNDQGWRILEKASVTTVRIAANKSSEGHTSPGRPIRNNNGAQATETWHQKNQGGFAVKQQEYDQHLRMRPNRRTVLKGAASVAALGSA